MTQNEATVLSDIAVGNWQHKTHPGRASVQGLRGCIAWSLGLHAVSDWEWHPVTTQGTTVTPNFQKKVPRHPITADNLRGFREN